MLTLQDCIAFSGLTPEQLEAVADYKHLPDVVAAEWAEGALETPRGCKEVEAMLLLEIEAACAHGDQVCAARYRHGLEEFLKAHSRNVQNVH